MIVPLHFFCVQNFTFVFLGYISYLDCSAACQGFLDLLDSWVEYRAFLGHPFL